MPAIEQPKLEEKKLKWKTNTSNTKYIANIGYLYFEIVVMANGESYLRVLTSEEYDCGDYTYIKDFHNFNSLGEAQAKAEKIAKVLELL